MGCDVPMMRVAEKMVAMVMMRGGIIVMLVDNDRSDKSNDDSDDNDDNDDDHGKQKRTQTMNTC